MVYKLSENYIDIIFWKGVLPLVYVLVGMFILMDMVTGLVKAFKEKNYTSSIMREGLFHKAGAVLVVVFATLVDYAQMFMELGVTVPMTAAVCGYIVLMEIGSIIENICAINPDILPDKLKCYFKKLSE